MEALLFGVFTACMALDQYTVVTTNVTAIDRLKGDGHAARLDDALRLLPTDVDEAYPVTMTSYCN